MELGSNESIKQAVMAGLGIALLSAHTIGAEIESGRLVRLDVEGLPIVRQWYVISRTDRSLSPTARAFRDFAEREGRTVSPAAWGRRRNGRTKGRAAAASSVPDRRSPPHLRRGRRVFRGSGVSDRGPRFSTKGLKLRRAHSTAVFRCDRMARLTAVSIEVYISGRQEDGRRLRCAFSLSTRTTIPAAPKSPAIGRPPGWPISPAR